MSKLYVVSITLDADLEVEDDEIASSRVREIRGGLRQIAEDFGLRAVAASSEFALAGRPE